MNQNIGLMAIINIQDIKVGMVLAEAAKHANGRVLLQAGAELNESHIRIFKTWGVLTVNVKQDDEQIAAKRQYSTVEINQAIGVKKLAFQHCDLKHPLMRELFRASIKLYLEQQDRKG